MTPATQEEIHPDDVSVAELVEQQRALVDRVEELEEKVEEKDERIDELERGLDIAMETVFELEDAVTGDYGSYHAQQEAEDGKCILGRVEDIERGEIDPGEVVANSNAGVDPSDLLPLHNMYLSAQNLEPEEHDLSPNQEIAARLFPYLDEYGFSNEGRIVLPSTKVKDIIDREIATPELAQRLDVDDPNANTIRRAMNFVGKFGKDMMEFDTDQKTNRIVIEREEWIDYTKEITDIVSDSTASDGGEDYGTVNSTGEDSSSQESEESVKQEAEEELEKLNSSGDYGVVITDGGEA